MGKKKKHISECKISDLVNNKDQSLPNGYKFCITNTIADYFLGKALFMKDIYWTQGQHYYATRINSAITFVEKLFSNHIEADQKIPKHVLFNSNLESGVFVVSNDINTYILM